MSWFRSGGSSAKPANRTDGGATPPSRFRVEALEPRLLLSGDPLDLLKAPLEPQIVPEPAAVVESQTTTPTIDWGAGDTQQAPVSDEPVAAAAPASGDDQQPVAADVAAVTDAGAQVAQATVANETTTSVATDTPNTVGAAQSDSAASH